MNKKEWDEEWKFEEKIRKLIRDNANPPHRFPRVGHRLDESQVESVGSSFITFLAKDRKHQQAEMLKRVPSRDVIWGELMTKLQELEDLGSPIVTSNKVLSVAKAIHDLVEKKLKGEE